MLKKTLFVSAFALSALVSGAFAQAYLDVIVRDFPVDAPGFEQFLGCDGSGNNQSTGICFQGDNYTHCPNGSELKYGEYAENSGIRGVRGYSAGPDRDTRFNGMNWSEPVKVTLGMVGEWLHYDKSNCAPEDIMEDPDGNRDHIVYRYCARPVQGNGNCGSAGNLESWFSDGGRAKTLRDVIELKEEDGKYVINHDYNTPHQWNSDGIDNGFFPLDKYDDGSGKTYGRQSLNFWCPDANTGNTTPDGICRTWHDAGGPRSSTAGRTAATNRGVLNKLHNYGFSLAGSGTFKYIEGTNDIFEFIGDDDMWIFIDGQLVADLGGVHLAAPAKLNINELASARKWTPGSTHSVNFFYMDRNTDGSNFLLRMSLNGMSESNFSAPTIKKSVTTIADDGSAKTNLYVSTELDVEDMNQRFSGNNSDYSIVVRSVEDGSICGYRLDKITYSGNAKAEGQLYNLEGKVICNGVERNLASGDSLSFNVDFEKSGSYPNTKPLTGQEPVKNKAGKPADAIKMAENTNKLQVTPFDPKVPDDNPKKPPFPEPSEVFGPGVVANIPGGGVVAPGFTGVNPAVPGSDNVNKFGTVGNIIPANKTGELIITAYPSAGGPGNSTNWQEVVNGDFFGLPPSANPDNGLYGIADPSKPNESGSTTTGGYAFVKNGFTQKNGGEGSANGSMQVSPTRCVSQIEGDKARINCLNFNFVALQPFQLAVTIYDQLGNFVTQYRETVDEQQFRYITQGPNYIANIPKPTPSTKCVAPDASNYGQPNVMTTNGRVNVGVNIYPFSQTGRKFGNGVYLVKVDRVDLPFEGCYNANGVTDMGTYPFIRYHTDMKFGWMRSLK